VSDDADPADAAAVRRARVLLSLAPLADAEVVLCRLSEDVGWWFERVGSSDWSEVSCVAGEIDRVRGRF
jgi:hypothetical protein